VYNFFHGKVSTTKKKTFKDRKKRYWEMRQNSTPLNELQKVARMDPLLRIQLLLTTECKSVAQMPSLKYVVRYAMMLSE